MKVFCYHGNKSTILLFNPIFRTTPEVSSKLYFIEIRQVSENCGLLITKELIFGFQILDLKDHFSASLKMPAKVTGGSLLIHEFTYSLFIGLSWVTSNMTGYSHSYHSIKLIHCGAPQRDVLSDKMVF